MHYSSVILLQAIVTLIYAVGFKKAFEVVCKYPQLILWEGTPSQLQNNQLALQDAMGFETSHLSKLGMCLMSNFKKSNKVTLSIPTHSGLLFFKAAEIKKTHFPFLHFWRFREIRPFDKVYKWS